MTTTLTTNETRVVLQPETLNMLEDFRNSMEHQLRHSTRYQITWIEQLENYIPVYNDYLGSIRLATEEQLEERIILNRQRIMYTGMGLIGSMALTSIGLPPIGGVIAIAVANVSANSSNSTEIIRLRDVWDASLKKLLDIIEK